MSNNLRYFGKPVDIWEGAMYFSSLHYPDLPAWRRDPGYSPIVAQALIEAYRVIITRSAFRPGSQSKHGPAWNEVYPATFFPMSLQQHMHIYFLHAAAYIEDSDLDLAIGQLDKAEDLAVGLGERGAQIDLLSLRITADHWRSHFALALQDCEQYLDLVWHLAADGTEIDRASALDVVTRLASFQVLAADFSAALRSSDQADHLMSTSVPRQSIPDSALGNLMLARANVYRLAASPNLVKALECAVAATKIYNPEKSANSLVRARQLTADIALDRAEANGGNRAADAFAGWLSLATPYADRAVYLAREIDDKAGLGLALLAQARLSLLSGTNTDTRAQIREALHIARNEDDPGLHAQALTALGNDMMARGERSSALGVYRTVITEVRGSEVPMLEIIPRRALLRAYHA